MPNWANPRITRPTKFTTAKMMARVDDGSQTNSFSSRPAVPMTMRPKAVILKKFPSPNKILKAFPNAPFGEGDKVLPRKDKGSEVNKCPRRVAVCKNQRLNLSIHRAYHLASCEAVLKSVHPLKSRIAIGYLRL